MGLKIVVNGKVIDDGISPVEETSNTAQNTDGRSYLDLTSATYLQDGTVVKNTNRGFNADISLPASANISKTYPGNKMTEAENARDGNISNLIAARAASDAANSQQKAVIDSAVRSATNLIKTGSVPGTANYTAVVKPTQNAG